MSGWEQWNRAVLDADAPTVAALVDAGVATTALHYDAFVRSSVSTPWSDKTLALYACGPPPPTFLGRETDTTSTEAVLAYKPGVLATQGALWFYHRLLSDPTLLTRIDLIHPLATVRPCVHGHFNDVDPDYTPWLVHLVSEHAWRPETPIQLLLLQLWQSDGAWSDDLRARRDIFPEPPVLVAYFLFYFRNVLPHAETSLRTWLEECESTMFVEPAFMYDLLAWDPTINSLCLNPYERAYALVLLGHDPPVGAWTEAQWAEMLYLGVEDAADALGVPQRGDTPWAPWLRQVLESDVSEATKEKLVLHAPTNVLETLLEEKAVLPWVALGYQGRGTPLDDRVLVLLDAFGEPNSQDWYDDVAARWRGSHESLQRFLDHARKSDRLPAVWWTAVAYGDTRWQEEVRRMVPLQTTCDDLLMRLGPDAVRQSLELWEGTAHIAAIRASVAGWMWFTNTQT